MCRELCGNSECGRVLIEKWGPETRPHFAVYTRKGAHPTPCKSGMSTEHLTAQKVVQGELNSGKSVIVRVRCKRCPRITDHRIGLKQGQECVIEARFDNKNDGKRCADLAIVAIDTNVLESIIEVKHTSRTNEHHRPKDVPWYEVKATCVLKEYANTLETNAYELKLDDQRMRTKTCDWCEAEIRAMAIKKAEYTRMRAEREAKEERLRAEREAKEDRLRAERDAEAAQAFNESADRVRKRWAAKRAKMRANRETTRGKATPRKRTKHNETPAVVKHRKLLLAQLRAGQEQYDVEHATSFREASMTEAEEHIGEEIERLAREHWLQFRPIGPCMPPDGVFRKIDYTIKRLQREEERGIDPITGAPVPESDKSA
jgi:hypothetical protein